MKPKLLMLITEDWYFWSHRLPIALAAMNGGFEVVIATRLGEYGDRIRDIGLRVVPIQMRRRGRSPLNEILAIYDIARIYRREKPDIVHHVTVKPVLYGSWAARLVGIPSVVNAIAGLGYVFIAKGLKASLVRGLISLAYLSALRPQGSKVIFQNQEDREMFIESRLVRRDQTILIRGSGVDLEQFSYSPESSEIPIVMYAGRILWDKGVGELVEASRLLNKRRNEFRVVLVGSPDPDNPKSISVSQINEWVEEGIVEWWGPHENMSHVLRLSAIVVLPSYREGLPKILLEAGAIGRPAIATDVTGCRDVVRDGYNGILVQLGDVSGLADAMERLLADEELRHEMGRNGRKIVEMNFSVDQIVAETLSLYQTLMGTNPITKEGVSLAKERD